MRDKRRLTWLFAACVLMISLFLAVGITFGRYRSEILGNLIFQVKPMKQLTFQSQKWLQAEDGSYALTFTMAEEADNCRMYLAVSEGITAPDALQVTLTLPIVEAGEDPAEEEQTEENLEAQEGTGDSSETPEEVLPVVLTATMEKITEGTALYATFGSGYVFRFYDAETGNEITLDLVAESAYVLTVTGLQSAAEQTSLLRLFVEYA